MEKVEKIHASTATAPLPSITSKSSSELQAFTGTSVNELCHLIADAPNIQCELDPIPTWFLKECATDPAPFLMDMFKKSLCSGEVSMALKKSNVMLILKKMRTTLQTIVQSPTCHSCPSYWKRSSPSDCRHTWMITNCFLFISLHIGAFNPWKRHCYMFC